MSSQRSVVASGGTFQVPNADAFRSTARIFVEQARRASPALAGRPAVEHLWTLANGAPLGASDEQHNAVCSFLDGLRDASQQMAVVPEAHLFVAKCAEYDRYIDKLAGEARANARGEWARRSLKSDNNAVLAQSIDEIAAHIRAFADPALTYESLAAYSQAKINAILPAEVAGMRQEANLSLILPFFERSLATQGDVAEFGCFRGVLSVKLAWMMKALAPDKHYYTFDTFHGFEIDDPAGLGVPGSGRLGVGSFGDNNDAYAFLLKWSRVLPLSPIKGDATKTCAELTKPLSFVWLDLDMDVLMDPILRQIWPLCSRDTIIGIDDVGRPENPTVGPWVDKLVESGAVECSFTSNDIAPRSCIRFLKKKADGFPTSAVDAWRSSPKS
jgi:hypothetical protein